MQLHHTNTSVKTHACHLSLSFSSILVGELLGRGWAGGWLSLPLVLNILYLCVSPRGLACDHYPMRSPLAPPLACPQTPCLRGEQLYGRTRSPQSYWVLILSNHHISGRPDLQQGLERSFWPSGHDYWAEALGISAGECVCFARNDVNVFKQKSQREYSIVLCRREGVYLWWVTIEQVSSGTWTPTEATNWRNVSVLTRNNTHQQAFR